MNSTSAPDVEIVCHHLRLMGFRDAGAWNRVRVLTGPSEETLPFARSQCAKGTVLVVLDPNPGFVEGLGIAVRGVHVGTSSGCTGTETCRVHLKLRTLHDYSVFVGGSGEPVVRIGDDPVWLWVAHGDGGFLLVGTALAADLVRYRQGDPAAVAAGQTSELWGIGGERPVYLYEAQLDGESPHERFADAWACLLAHALAARLGVSLKPILPDYAPGALVVTGDDDQAYLEKYAEQQALLAETPVTYFLHPQTRHTAETLRGTLSHPGIDLQLHPDALDAPSSYDERFATQAAWFQELVGRKPAAVRNHGFLNDGYWGHLRAWRRGGIRISSNLPGVDGRVLNGSLLPARVAMGSELTEHWSILTAIGDGAQFALNRTPQAAAACIFDCADRIRSSGVPGVIVINLHPQNVTETRLMHQAALEVIQAGFHPWNLAQCLDWFERADRDPFVTSGGA